MAGLCDDGLTALVPGALYVVDPLKFWEKGVLQVSRGNLAQTNVKINFFFQNQRQLKDEELCTKKACKGTLFIRVYPGFSAEYKKIRCIFDSAGIS